MEHEKEKFQLWEWVKAISTVVLVGVIANKICTTPVSFNVDFPTLLSLLLALFSVALSALFYFKATDTSNAFYDNTYKFTKDIAELLVKIESGFGERLKHLDEGYSSMQNYLQNLPNKSSDDVEKTKKKLETEKQEVEKLIVERDKIIQQLAERSQLQEEEKKSILDKLKEKEIELTQVQNDVNKLNKRLIVERMNKKIEREKSFDFHSGFAGFTLERVIKKIGIEKVVEAPTSYIRRKFSELADDLPKGYLADMEKNGFFDVVLTASGAHFLKKIASDYLENGSLDEL